MKMTVSRHDAGECMRITQLLGRLGDRWTLPVVVALSEESLRFNQIRRVVDGISQQMLTRTLRALQRDGMVTRTVHPTVPPQVEYALTAMGHSLAKEGERLGQWVLAHLAEIDGHRARYDEETDAA